MLYLVGLGGAGSKIVDAFYQQNVVKRIIKRFHAHDQWSFSGVAIDTSENIKSLGNIPAEHRVLIGKSRVKGHGTGVDPSLGKKILQEELGLAMHALSKAVSVKPWLIVIFAGLGGGTGTGGLEVLTEKIKETYGCKVLGVFILPSVGEGRVYSKNAFDHLEKVLSSVDGAFLLDNNVVTDRGADILGAHKVVNRSILGFFRMIDEGFLERCLETVSTIAYSKIDSDHASVKDLFEKMLREDLYLRFDLDTTDEFIFLGRGNLGYLYAHVFAQGWAQSKYGSPLEYEFYDVPGTRDLEVGLLIKGAKDLNGRFDDISEVESDKQPTELDELLKDIHSIF